MSAHSAEPPFRGQEPGTAPPGLTLAAYAEAKALPQQWLRDELGLRDVERRGQPAVAIPYRDQDGAEIAVRYRVSMNGSQRLVWKQGTKAKGLLYGLDRRKRAVTAGEALLGEGESDVQTAALHDIVAFGIPGVSMFDDELTSPALDGIDRLILIQEPGEAAERLLEALRRSRLRERIRVATLGEHKDISALHLALGGDREAFRAAVEAAIAAAEPLEPAADEEQASVEPYPFLDLDGFLAAPPAEPPWDWRGWFARGDLVLLAGDPGAGKSMVALAWAVAAASGGGELLGEAVAERRSLYIDLENPEDVAYARLYALGLREATPGFAYVHRPGYFNLLDDKRECIARLRASIAASRAELVVIDSFRRAAPGLDENDSRAVGGLLTALRDIAAALGCTILVIHHPRKPTGDGKVEALYAARGSGDLIGSADSYLYFRRLSGGLTRVEHGKARRGREHKPTCFRIGEGEAGEPVIEHVEVAPSPAGEELLEAVLAYVKERPGEPQTAIEEAVHGSRKRVRDALELGATKNLLARGPGRARNGKYWYPAGHAAVRSPGDHGASAGDQPLPGVEEGLVAQLAAPPKGAGEQTGDQPAAPAEASAQQQPERIPDENGDIEW